jgi:hypothetical protein
VLLFRIVAISPCCYFALFVLLNFLVSRSYLLALALALALLALALPSAPTTAILCTIFPTGIRVCRAWIVNYHQRRHW